MQAWRKLAVNDPCPSQQEQQVFGKPNTSRPQGAVSAGGPQNAWHQDEHKDGIPDDMQSEFSVGELQIELNRGHRKQSKSDT